MPDIIKKTVHVHFDDAQLAALSHQMADVQSAIEGVDDEKKKAVASFTARRKVLESRMSEYAAAVRAGEGDIVIDCMWKPDAAQPLEYLWRLDTWEIMETRQLSRTAQEKADAEKAHQLDLVTPTAAPGPDGLAAAGAQPGTPVMDKARKLRTGPTPPCPAPVADAPGGICGADGDREFFRGFCAEHHGSLSVAEMESIIQAIQESRRLARLQASAERRAAATREMDEAEEDSAWAGLHAQADRAEGAELDAIGRKLGCSREIEEGNGAEGDIIRAKEPDSDYRARVKVAIDQAHKGAAARAVARGAISALVPLALAGDDAALAKLWGQGVKSVVDRVNGAEVVRLIVRDSSGKLSIAERVEAVPPVVRQKPRELTPDLIAQLAQAARAGGVPLDDGPAPGNEAPPDEAPDDDAAPGNEAEPPPPDDEEIDGPQPD